MEKELQADVITYSAAINAACPNTFPRFEGDARVWGFGVERDFIMQSLGFRAAVSSNRVVCAQACEKGHEWQMALALLAEIPHRSIQGNVITYSSAPRLWFSEGQKAKVKSNSKEAREARDQSCVYEP